MSTHRSSDYIFRENPEDQDSSRNDSPCKPEVPGRWWWAAGNCPPKSSEAWVPVHDVLARCVSKGQTVIELGNYRGYELAQVGRFFYALSPALGDDFRLVNHHPEVRKPATVLEWVAPAAGMVDIDMDFGIQPGCGWQSVSVVLQVLYHNTAENRLTVLLPHLLTHGLENWTPIAAKSISVNMEDKILFFYHNQNTGEGCDSTQLRGTVSLTAGDGEKTSWEFVHQLAIQRECIVAPTENRMKLALDNHLNPVLKKIAGILNFGDYENGLQILKAYIRLTGAKDPVTLELADLFIFSKDFDFLGLKINESLFDDSDSLNLPPWRC